MKAIDPKQIGHEIGAAMARDVIADDMPRSWTGLDAQDGDRLQAAGIEPDSDAWNQAEEAARAAFVARVGKA